ncbi:hypothetical protein ENUP19_0296G0005 [Entamoeba nuttalli]|uniref:Uncharacterized protein n=2 Tax=Entamoeba nuttalli TaxID=412467 RepID=K2HA33_ENTNP|nr:hypothetical protein ENU1_127810 [Entamoeba nuttalli P19]EKE39449.1 hypothetical protein ENU1_127810 [Entamoeba nuttalli P19]|eukprot:XP_008858217.1 hypothetical protein ENU1_127810 [Entamoeba nuttalli P19]
MKRVWNGIVQWMGKKPKVEDKPSDLVLPAEEMEESLFWELLVILSEMKECGCFEEGKEEIMKWQQHFENQMKIKEYEEKSILKKTPEEITVEENAKIENLEKKMVDVSRKLEQLEKEVSFEDNNTINNDSEDEEIHKSSIFRDHYNKEKIVRIAQLK